jgi:ATP-dependent RNA helicase HelY
MLPAIYFVFSRVGCDRSVEYVAGSGIRLTTQDEANHIRAFAEERAAWLDEDDLVTLGFYEFLDSLAAGIAAHHAGMLPLFKETVEELFEQGLVKIVFATETLSLGINMPARTVVIEDLWKFQGERHELLTPGEYTQLTGRAGRRGIDELGHAVVVYQENVKFERVAALASTRTYELSSSFRPSYNMAVNLVRNYNREQTHRLLNSSFAQFLADRSVVSLERQMARDRRELAELQDKMACHLGDFAEYWAIREKAKSTRDGAASTGTRVRSDAVKKALAALRPGDVVFVPEAKRRGLAAVVSMRQGKPLAITQDRREIRLLVKDFEQGPDVLTRVKLPKSGRSKSGNFRRDVASALAALDVRPPRRGSRSPADKQAAVRAKRLDEKAAEHPCHSCPERRDHERWATLASRVQATIAGEETRVRNRTETLGKRFERVREVLDELGYVRGFDILPKGEMLAHVYGESDILVTEAIENRLLADLDPAEIASMISTLVYEPRERIPRPGDNATATTAQRFRELSALWANVRRSEERHRVELCRELELGFATPIYHWAKGRSLEEVLGETRMTPGDFVRNCKQLLDLMRQIEEVVPGWDQPAATIKAAREAINRGVVAYTGV